MPISTQNDFLPEYREDIDHFKHVLDHLIKPVIDDLNYELIPPNARGADLIQAEIIKNLETADLVLCDMSSLNPNVFFELGIRTSLNKPVCMIRDDKTPKVPFDTLIINFHTYKCGLDPWDLEEERAKLKTHLNESIERSNGENMLWKYFGFTSVGKEYDQEGGVEAKLDFLTSQVGSLARVVRNQDYHNDITRLSPEVQKEVNSKLHNKLREVFDYDVPPNVSLYLDNNNECILDFDPANVSRDKIAQIEMFVRDLGMYLVHYPHSS